MTQTTLKSYRKPLLELVETESAEVIAASPKIVPGTSSFDLEEW